MATAAAAALSGFALAGASVTGATAAEPAAPGVCPGETQPAAGMTVSELSSSVRCVVDRARAAGGLPALARNQRLTVAANSHAADMVRRHYFAHTSLAGTTFVNRIRQAGYLPTGRRWQAGEALAWASGADATAGSIVAAWMASPPHRRILLNPRYTDVGVGVVMGSPVPNASQGPAITVAADLGHVG